MKKSLMVWILILAMVLSAAACGSGNSGSGGKDTTGEKSSVSDGKITTIKMAVLTMGDTSDGDKIVEKANELLASDGLAIEVQFIKFSNWKEQTNLLATGGKGSIDILPIWGQPLAIQVSNGSLMPMDEFYAQYEAQMKDLFTEDQMKACYYDGKLYGIPTERDLAASHGFAMRKDILDELGYTTEDIKDFNDLEKVLLEVKEKYPEMYALVPHNGPSMFGGGWDWDTLGTGNLGVLANLAQDPTVVNIFADENFLQFCEMIKKWNDEGLIMPDGLSNTEMGSTLVAAGRGFGYFAPLKAGYAEQESNKIGKEMVTVEFSPAMATTNNISNLLWCISSNSANPEEAMRLLVKLYTDAELSNLLINGIEGVHYVYSDDSKKLITYPEGLDGATTAYLSAGWAWPNQYLTPPWVPNPVDIWEQLDKFNSEAIPSVALGFMPNLDEVANEVTACTNVTDKYMDAITSGTVDVRETAQIMNAELETAGIQKIIEVKQAQLNEWLAAQEK